MKTPALMKCRRGRPKVLSDELQSGLILDEARKTLTEGGYDSLTMDAVAARCHMSKRTIYRHFASKEALLVAVIVDHRSTLIGLPGDYDHMPVEEALAQIFRIDIDGEADLERWAFMRVFKAESAKSPELHALLMENTAQKVPAMLAEWLEEQTSKGRLSISAPKNAARILLDMIFGAIFDKHGKMCEWKASEDRRTYMRECIDIFVNGSRAPFHS